MASDRVHYGKLSGLKDVYLEDSFVLAVAEEPTFFRLTLLVALREAHADFAPPAWRERYCYRLGILDFQRTRSVTWSRRTMLKYRDADGRVDFGNIDVFYREGEATYHLEGDWGVVDVVSDPPFVKLTT